ncbi:hypothetical protein [Brachybacterium hainanense]|uniref:Uncharacterized protein n=1 Tax=Brachybacterium hainanense TaxID=1541174 RepID=A0ABV6RF10_9MICO
MGVTIVFVLLTLLLGGGILLATAMPRLRRARARAQERARHSSRTRPEDG